jgi:hypothetical protein
MRIVLGAVAEATYDFMQKKGLRYARGWDLFIVYNDQLLKTLPKEERLAGTSLRYRVCACGTQRFRCGSAFLMAERWPCANRHVVKIRGNQEDHAQAQGHRRGQPVHF